MYEPALVNLLSTSWRGLTVLYCPALPLPSSHRQLYASPPATEGRGSKVENLGCFHLGCPPMEIMPQRATASTWSSLFSRDIKYEHRVFKVTSLQKRILMLRESHTTKGPGYVVLQPMPFLHISQLTSKLILMLRPLRHEFFFRQLPWILVLCIKDRV